MANKLNDIDIVITSAFRTPIGSLLGSLADHTATPKMTLSSNGVLAATKAVAAVKEAVAPLGRYVSTNVTGS